MTQFNKSSLNHREQEALAAACSALYFRDSSDYLTYLWNVVAAFDPNFPEFPDDEYLLKRLRELQPEIFAEED